ncbi:hypothetical protein AB4452_04620 [Vibrio lentus]
MMSYKLNWPIETEQAIKLWGSEHKCNRMKAIIAFSLDLDNANDNLRRFGYSLQWRKRAIAAFGKYVADPQARLIPFSEMSDFYWDEMPIINPIDYTDKFEQAAAFQEERMERLALDKADLKAKVVAKELAKQAQAELVRKEKEKEEYEKEKTCTAKEAEQIQKSKELAKRKEQALEWINVKKWEAIDLANKIEGYRVGQVSIEKVCKDKGIPLPTSHWFDGEWKIKEQFKEYYNVR